MQPVLDVPERIALGRIMRRAGRLDRDVGEFGERDQLVEMDEGLLVLAVAVEAAMVDDHLEVGMCLGDLAELVGEDAAHRGDRDAFLLGGRPHPVEQPVVQPLLLGRLQQRPAQAHHAGLVAPALDAVAAVGIGQRELAHHGEAVGILLGGIEGELVGGRVPAIGRMDQRGGDAGLIHLLQCLFGRETLDLAMEARGRCHGLRPDMNLRVDDFHSGNLSWV